MVLALLMIQLVQLAISTILALDALNNKSIHLICGGSDKKLDIDQLVYTLNERNNIKLYLLAGTGTNIFIDKLKKQSETKSYKCFDSLKEAVKDAYNNASRNETILLSPGFASFANV